MSGPVVCARETCGAPWSAHRTDEHGRGQCTVPGTDCRGFLWVDPTGTTPAYEGAAPSWSATGS